MALTGAPIAPRARRTFTPEFKAETVELVRMSGKSISQVCRDLDLKETAVRRLKEIAQKHYVSGARTGTPGSTT